MSRGRRFAAALSGPASSCVALDPTTTRCLNFTPVALKTNRGDFLLYEPFTASDGPSDGTGAHTVNWGMFWTNVSGQRAVPWGVILVIARLNPTAGRGNGRASPRTQCVSA